MLGMIAGSRERPEATHRYSVKCDRLTATRIEVAAKKAGLSVNAFVQQHFDTILEAKPKSGRAAAFDPADFVRRHKVSHSAARIWGALAARVNAEGLARVSLQQLGRDADISPPTSSSLMAQLAEAGMVEIVDPPFNGRLGLYRIVWEEGA